jgi:hypothetical protein
MKKQRRIRKSQPPSNGEKLVPLKCNIPMKIRGDAWQEKIVAPYTPIAVQIVEGLEIRKRLTRSEREEILSSPVLSRHEKGRV